MAYTAYKLITNAWYLSGIVARGLQQPSGEQINDGLDLLNYLLDFKSSDINLIPYWTKYDFAFVQNQETYNIENLVAVESLTFSINNVRYSMQDITRKDYFGTGRVNNIASLPYNYHVERTLNGSDIYIYFLPQDNYPAQLIGKFALTNVTLFQDLELTYDRFYIEYLRHALAEYMCNEYGVMLAPAVAMKLKEIVAKLRDVSPPDLSTDKLSYFSKQRSINYADVNIGRGWRPT